VKKLVAPVQKAPNNLDRRKIRIRDFLQLIAIERDDLCLWKSHKDRRLAGDDELRVFVFAKGLGNQDEESQGPKP
jgi:hypothetical protein